MARGTVHMRKGFDGPTSSLGSMHAPGRLLGLVSGRPSVSNNVSSTSPRGTNSTRCSVFLPGKARGEEAESEAAA